MNKKIISILFLLIVLISIALIYTYSNKVGDDVKQYDMSSDTIDENNIADEIEDIFIEEDDEIEIGDMV
jgi:peptidoglycan hydrolase CwlO-like protein